MFGSHERSGRGLRLCLFGLSLAFWVAFAVVPSFGNNLEDSDKPKLQVHGFLTQAYATADFTGATAAADELLIGIPDDGTFNYRAMALQFRYEISPKDIMIVQFSNRANGINPIDDFEDEIELDWAFYERRITSSASVKVGRVQIPFGIFNEIRDVGTILPFYRPAFTVYREGGFTSETVDGIVFSTAFWGDKSWSLDFDIYFGDWPGYEDDQTGMGMPLETETKDALGIQLWLNTPVSGLRFGIAGQTKDVSGGQEGFNRRVGEEQGVDDFMFSLEGVFEKWVIRGEYRAFGPDSTLPGPPLPSPLSSDFDLDLTTWYAQLGWIANDKIHLYLQYEAQGFEIEAPVYTNSLTVEDRTDFGFAFNYFFSANLVLKAEYHDVGGETLDFLPAFTSRGFQLQPIAPDRGSGSYSILSLSASF